MTLHAPQMPGNEPERFGTLVTEAVTSLVSYRQTYLHALEIGIRPQDILAYSKGELAPEEHRSVTTRISRSSWAQSRVVALVKARRRGPLLLVLPDNDVEGMKALDSL